MKTWAVTVPKWLRWALLALLLYGVYTETGKWTTLALALSCVATEILTREVARTQPLVLRLGRAPSTDDTVS